MTTLVGKDITSYIGDIAQVSNTGTGIDGTLRAVESGTGTASALKISTAAVQCGRVIFTNGTLTTTTGDITVTPNITFNGTASFGSSLSVTNLVVTSFTINGNDLVLNDDVTFGGSVTTADDFTISGAFPLTLTITASTNVTLPTTGTLATRAGTETFTNKTLTTPIIASILTNSGAATLTLPTTNDTLVGRATTDTLTNKTLTSPVINSSVTGTALAIASGKKLTVSNTITLTGTDSQSVNLTPVYAKIGLAAGQAITNNTLTTVAFDTTIYDSQTYWNNTTKVFQPLVAGIYQINVQLMAVLPSDQTTLIAYIYTDAGVKAYNIARASSTATLSSNVSTIVSLNGSTNYVYAAVIIGAGSTSLYNDVNGSYIEIVKVSDIV